jgi:hypothetical protein
MTDQEIEEKLPADVDADMRTIAAYFERTLSVLESLPTIRATGLSLSMCIKDGKIEYMSLQVREPNRPDYWHEQP